MSPEQVEGKEVDRRSDIFSLGAVLYEMLTGRRAFEGKSQLSVASAILEKEPEPISALKPMTPPTLEHVVKKCLAKHPDERWQSAGDLASELKWIGETQSLARPAQPVAARRFLLKPGRVVTTIATLTVFGASLFVWGYFSRPIPQPQTIRAALPPPEGAAFSVSTSIAGSVGISPDARLLVFTAQQKGGVPQLWLRSLDSLAAHPLDGTDYGFAPFWSPDSRFVAYSAPEGKLKRVDLAGSPPQLLCDTTGPNATGGAWNSDGVIVFGGSWDATFPMSKTFASGSPTVNSKIASLVCSGNTGSAQAIWKAYQWLKTNPDAAGAINAMVFFTDGQPNGLTANWPIKTSAALIAAGGAGTVGTPAYANSSGGSSGSATASGETGVAMGGALERYAIDYAKCMFCALCVEPCPVDCIFMGATHDLSCYSRDGCIVDFAALVARIGTADGRDVHSLLHPMTVEHRIPRGSAVHGLPNASAPHAYPHRIEMLMEGLIRHGNRRHPRARPKWPDIPKWHCAEEVADRRLR
jgi:ferredoxin